MCMILVPMVNIYLTLWKTQDLCLLNTQSFTHGVFTRVNNKNKSERSVIDYMFCTYDLLSNISSFHIDEMKEFTPWRQLKTGKTFTDHNAMVMKLVIPKSLKRHKVPGRQIVWDFDNPSGWDKYHKLTRTNPSLNKIWVDCENLGRLPDGRPKSTDYCTGVSDVRGLQINLMVHLIEKSGSY